MEKLNEYFAAKRGRMSELARKLGLTPGAVHQWNDAGQVPAEQVLAVSKYTGIPRSQLRPDLYPPRKSA